MQCNTIPQDNPSPLSNDNYKLTRAIWFALHAPHEKRHSVLLDDDTPEVYRRLFDAILDGARGLARIAIENGDEARILDIVENLPAPRLIQTRPRPRPDAPDYQSLAAELFGDVGDDFDLSGIGTGDWPGAPGHTCAAKQASGTALTIRPHETHAARMFNPTWRTCPGCLHKRVIRLARQTLVTIAAAGAMTWALLPQADYKRFTANMRQHRKRIAERARRDARDGYRIAAINARAGATGRGPGHAIARHGTIGATGQRRAMIEIPRPGHDARGPAVSYRALPDDDGRYFVMSTHGLAGATVPTDKRALYDLLRVYANTPDDKRASASHGYGGNFRKLRGDGRGAGVRLWTDASLETVAAALGAKIKAGRNTLRIAMEAEESHSRLVAAGIALRAKKGQQSAVDALAAQMTGQDVTLKVQSESPSLYLKRDTPPDDGPAPPIAPIYLPSQSAIRGLSWPT